MRLICSLFIAAVLTASATAFRLPLRKTFGKNAFCHGDFPPSRRAPKPLHVATEMKGEPPKRTRKERLEAARKSLQVHCIGLSIHHSTVDVREKLAIPEADWNKASNELCNEASVTEAALLSTCNRFEVYFSATNRREAMTRVTKYLSEQSNIPIPVLRKNLFMLSGDDAVWHIMRVSAGLDSLVVGENQILSQVGQCYLHSIKKDGRGGKVLARLLNHALAAGKRVRSETNINKGSVSVSSAAVELSEGKCQQHLNLPFSTARITVIGAGKMCRLLITHLASRGVTKITIVNRSKERPQELSEQFRDVDIEIRLLEDLWQVVGSSDIVYTAASTQDPVISAKEIQEHRIAHALPLMLVDIAVPRNVADNCNEVPNVRAYNVDDLEAVVAKNTAIRQREILEAEALLREEADSFSNWRRSLSAVPAINQLQERCNNMRMKELKRYNAKLRNLGLNDTEREAVQVIFESMSRGIVNKLLHGPMTHLHRTESMEEKRIALNELSSMFLLQDDDDEPRQHKRRRR